MRVCSCPDGTLANSQCQSDGVTQSACAPCAVSSAVSSPSPASPAANGGAGETGSAGSGSGLAGSGAAGETALAGAGGSEGTDAGAGDFDAAAALPVCPSSYTCSDIGSFVGMPGAKFCTMGLFPPTCDATGACPAVPGAACVNNTCFKPCQ